MSLRTSDRCHWCGTPRVLPRATPSGRNPLNTGGFPHHTARRPRAERNRRRRLLARRCGALARNDRFLNLMRLDKGRVFVRKNNQPAVPKSLSVKLRQQKYSGSERHLPKTFSEISNGFWRHHVPLRRLGTAGILGILLSGKRPFAWEQKPTHSMLADRIIIPRKTKNASGNKCKRACHGKPFYFAPKGQTFTMIWESYFAVKLSVCWAPGYWG